MIHLSRQPFLRSAHSSLALVFNSLQSKLEFLEIKIKCDKKGCGLLYTFHQPLPSPPPILEVHNDVKVCKSVLKERIKRNSVWKPMYDTFLALKKNYLEY